ncbi:MAG: hypothetical protein OXP36_12200, partial [Gammaproteobacteria bacterium]|nr:hypothetical protein [Gammaproteobacteria bacterium]
MTAPDEPVHIQPAKAPLSDRGSRQRRLPGSLGPTRNRARRAIGFGIAMLVLGALATFVFVFLPDQVVDPVAPTRPAAVANGRPSAPPADSVAPFEAADLARARAEAEAKLAEFFALESQLNEQLNVTAWGADDLRGIKDRAGTGDQLFMEGRYQESLDEYAGAVEDMAALADKGRAQFRSALANGQAALAELDHPGAVEAFETALAIRPNDRDATAGRDRASVLPEIVELLRQSERAVLRGEYAEADRYLSQVRALDPATVGLSERAAKVADARATQRRRATLSEGFAALERGEPETAIAAFDRVLKANPDDPDGLAGLQQANQARLLAEIDRLREAAEQQESEDQWSTALATYDAILDMDPSLRFARDGKARIAARVALIESMQTFIDDPGLLSDDDQFAHAKKVLADAKANPAGGPLFQTQLDDLNAVVERASTPVPLVIDSDNETEIMIQKIGTFGPFLRHELKLRPGRYVIIGSRDGYRDVRDEVILE